MEKSEPRFYLSNQHEHCSGEGSGQKSPVQLMFCVNFSLRTQTVQYCNLTWCLRAGTLDFFGNR